jgi:hypothetical protein
MFNTRERRSRRCGEVTKLADQDLAEIRGGMFRQPPMPPVPQTSFRVPMPAPSPFSFNVGSTGGQHTLGAGFQSGPWSGSAQVITPAPLRLPPMPHQTVSVPGGMSVLPQMPQAFTAGVSYRIRF